MDIQEKQRVIAGFPHARSENSARLCVLRGHKGWHSRLAVICLALWPVVCPAAAYEARVVGVHDGDTLTALTAERHQVKVRLSDIDCPELRQPFGYRAKQALSDLVFGRTVDVAPRTTDRYGRTIGTISVGGVGVNASLVEQGMCRVYTQYNHDPSLPAVEDAARTAHRGLWSDPHSVAPWEWRRTHR